MRSIPRLFLVVLFWGWFKALITYSFYGAVAGTILGLSILSIACQSEDDKRAGALREKLHKDIEQIEAVNNNILAEQEAFYKLYEQANHPWAAGYLQRLEQNRLKFPAELAELASHIDTTPNPSLQMLSHQIQAQLTYQQQILKEAQASSKLFSPEAIKKDNEAWRKAWQPRIFSGRPEGPVVFAPPTAAEKQEK